MLGFSVLRTLWLKVHDPSGARWCLCAELRFLHSHIPGWGLCTYIVKANDDLRQVRDTDWFFLLRILCFYTLVCQEQFAMQLIMQLIDIWDKAGLMVSTISPYRWRFSRQFALRCGAVSHEYVYNIFFLTRILATEPTAGLIEVVADSVPLKVITKK